MDTTTNTNNDNLWNVVLAFSLNTCASAFNGAYLFRCFRNKQTKTKKCPVRYGAGSCAMISETETPSLDELSLNHYPENTIRPRSVGEL